MPSLNELLGAGAAQLPRSAAPLAEAQHLLSMGQIASAKALLLKALDRAATRPEARYLLAVADVMQGNPAAAIEHAIVAVTASPRDARYRFTLGRAFKANGNLGDAERAYREALELAPGYVEAMVSLGIVLKARGDADGAIAVYDRAIALAPEFAAAHANRATALALRAALEADGSTDEAPTDAALEAQTRAVGLAPGNAVLHRNLGVMLVRARRRWDAAGAFNQSLAADPSDVHACLHLGFCLRALGASKLACEVYEKWLGQNAPNAVVMRALSGLLTRDGQVDAALPWAEQAAELDPDPYSLLQLGNTYLQARRLEDAMAHCRQAVDLAGGRAALYPTYLLGSNYLYEDPQTIFDLHAEFGRCLPPPRAERPRWQPLAEGQRLRVGYVSGDFVRHSVSYFLGALLERHDKARFEVTCYNNLGWSDGVTERLKTYGHRWFDCEGLSDDALRRQIEADGIHVLIDLSGHTSHSRVFMFGLGCAPVQLSFLGYPTVSGLPSNDFRISDSVIDPGDMPVLANEQPLCLPRTMFCYRPDEQPDIGAVPALGRGHVTFGSFNNIAKVSDHTLALWAQAMQAVPGSRLLLKAAAMAQVSNRDNIERFMAAHGVAPERLTLQPWVASKHSHLSQYNEIDVALDPYPYNGATTTCEALWMGVPVVSLHGRTHTSRMGASILRGIGKAEWVTHSDAAYVATVARLAGDLHALAEWRLQARRQLAASELFDEPGFTTSFEALLSQAWALAGEHSFQAASADGVIRSP